MYDFCYKVDSFNVNKPETREPRCKKMECSLNWMRRKCGFQQLYKTPIYT